MISFDDKLQPLLGKKSADALESGLGITTVGDLLRHYPRRYDERGKLTEIASLELGEHVSVQAKVQKCIKRSMKARRGKMTEAVITDGTSELHLVFFGGPAHSAEKELLPGTKALFAGKVGQFRNKLQLAHPAYEVLTAESSGSDFLKAFLPVYPASQGINTWNIENCVKQLLEIWDGVETDPLPSEVRERHGLIGLEKALRAIHRPESWAEVAIAQKRLKWDEALAVQLALAQRRKSAGARPAPSCAPKTGAILDAFDERLPFTLTAGQVAVGEEIAHDLTGTHPMNRLLQGEVGSGKAQPLDAKVLTPTGFKRMGDVRHGDEIVAADGEVSVVTGVFPQGERDVYRVVLSDGRGVECDLDHLWAVRALGEPLKVLTLREIRQELGTEWHLPMVVAPELDCPTERAFDPYELGSRLPDVVPDEYLLAPVKDRQALLNGLLDAAGTGGFRTAALAENVAWLAESLGGTGTITRAGDRYEVSLRLPDAGPVRSITAVEYVGRKPVQCISIAHPDQLYVTDHFIVTHNTMVALRAMLQVVDSGRQAAMLAPTEVLAAQHARSLREMLGDLAMAGELGGAEQATRVTLLTGSMNTAQRKQALLDIVTGEAGIVVGTHAIIQDKVEFHSLGMVVVDEQHRFGVEQRDTLRARAGKENPHVLVMTATPIPRTVAMTVYGDLEVSALRELPQGRSPIKTSVVPMREKPAWLDRAFARVREEVAQGHQAYFVCPRIGDGDGDDDEPPSPSDDGSDRRPPLSVVDVANTLAAGPLKGLRIEILHGRLPSDEKDAVMRGFAANDVQVLVATTVVEVGVNVPNATVMAIMDADRFGVSQLHQLRGRVGRGSAPGLCLLVTEMAEATPTMDRLRAVESTLDGFELAQLDLELRREGDILGAAQSGKRSALKMLSLLRDEDVITAARVEAQEFVDADPDLKTQPGLAAMVAGLLTEERAEFLEKA